MKNSTPDPISLSDLMLYIPALVSQHFRSRRYYLLEYSFIHSTNHSVSQWCPSLFQPLWIQQLARQKFLTFWEEEIKNKSNKYIKYIIWNDVRVIVEKKTGNK